MPNIYISAAHKSSGKTTVSIGICSALTQNGIIVQPFKKGPDYIDPLWLSQATGRSCYNLDFFTTPKSEILKNYQNQYSDSDIAIVEGNKGLFDGMDLHGTDSNAAMAKMLNSPIVLVIDTSGMTRGVAPLVLGYQSFDENLNIVGVILNKVGGSRHESKLISVLQEYTNVPVVGSIWRNDALNIDERHLGLIPSNEQSESQNIILKISEIIKEQVDLDLFCELSGLDLSNSGCHSSTLLDSITIKKQTSNIKIGILKDAAFGFYYPDDLEIIKEAGVELIFIDALNDSQLPNIDGLFIGGGFPETHMVELSSNTSFINSVYDFIESNGVVYAECGGLMYLARSLTWDDKHCKMCGVIPADVTMHEKPQGRGYIKLVETSQMPWPEIDNVSDDHELSAHEFHYSRLENLPQDSIFAYEVLRGTGIDGKHDGFVYKNLLANYAHMRNVGNNHWTERFLAKIKQVKQDTTEVI